MATTDAPKRRPLADIAEDIYRLLTDAEGDVTDLGDVLDKLDCEFTDKVQAYVIVLVRLENERRLLDDLSAYYEQKSDARERQHTNLKERLKNALLTTDKTKIKTATTTVWIQETTALQLLPGWADRHWPSSPYVKVEEVRTADKKGIREALERGEQVPDAELVTNKHLRFS